MPETRKPPKFAAALLRLVGPDGSALAGDLLEHYQSGQSRWWYCRQVIAAITCSVLRDLRSHPFLATRAAFMGWLFLWIGMRVVFAVVELPEWLFATGIVPSLLRHGITFPSWMRGFPANAIWKGFVFAASGWMIARAHSRHPNIVLLYVAFVVCSNVVVFTSYVSDPDRYYSIWQLIVDLLFLYPVAALGGGLWGLIECEARKPTTS